MKGTSCFIEEAVRYIYKKQLEEADIIVINKTDLVTEDELSYVKGIVEDTYNKKIIYMNAYNKTDVRNWLQILDELNVPTHRSSLELDYDIYGSGEAALAWVDQKLSLHTQKTIAVKTAFILSENIYERIRNAGLTIGHLKFLLSDEHWHTKISFTANGIKEYPVIEFHLSNHLDILINARVQTSPQILKQIVSVAIEETITQTGCRIMSHHLSAFQPGYPKPLHRITV